MKKYFVADTNEEIQAGETLQLDFTKEVKHGRIKTTQDITLNEITIPWLLKTGIIEEREVEEEEDNTSEEDLLDFDDETPCEALEALEEDFEALEERVESLEQEIRQLKDMHKDYVALTHKMLDTFKEFVLSIPEKDEKKNAQPKKK
jgi:hypothetical protein